MGAVDLLTLQAPTMKSPSMFAPQSSFPRCAIEPTVGEVFRGARMTIMYSGLSGRSAIEARV